LEGRPRLGTRLRQAGAGQAQGCPRLACAGRAFALRDPLVPYRRAVPLRGCTEDHRCRRGGRRLRDELSRPRAPPALEEVSARLARIHSETARDKTIPARFPTDAIFHDIRLSPYLEAAAVRHPDRAEALHRIVATTATTKHALVHGDVSPKNILVGPTGPIFLDAECAWFGDPAFDLGFCLNHLLLKCLVRPDVKAALLASYEAMSRRYLGGVDWEPAADIEARVATLLPGLLLARVDGKSPVEYLTKDEDRERVRRVSCHLLDQPVARVALVAERWKQVLA
jgi:hypothetical protein